MVDESVDADLGLNNPNGGNNDSRGITTSRQLCLRVLGWIVSDYIRYAVGD